MDGDERDIEDYFEALAGRRDGGPGPAALRAALQAQARTLREAERARADDLDEAERARMDSLKQRLVAAGAFRPPPAPAPGALARWRDRLFGGSWQRPLALAAGVLLASVLGLRLLPTADDEDPSRTLRGGAGAVIEAADPAARVAALEAELKAAGAQVLVVPLNAREWSLGVEVADASRVEAVRGVLQRAGFRAEGAPPYELGVRAAR